MDDPLVCAMDAYVTGDGEAFSAVHRRVEGIVRAKIRGWIADPASVDDVVQDTFIRAHLARARFEWGTRSCRRLVAWFLRIARHVAIDHLRKQGRRRNREQLGDDPDQVIDAERGDGGVWGPEIAMLDDERGRARRGTVRRAVGSLRPIDREILVLYRWRNMTIAEISSHLAVRPETARVRAHRAQRRLARALGGPPSAAA